MLKGGSPQNAPRSRALSGKDFMTGDVARERKEGDLGEIMLEIMRDRNINALVSEGFADLTRNRPIE